MLRKIITIFSVFFIFINSTIYPYISQIKPKSIIYNNQISINPLYGNIVDSYTSKDSLDMPVNIIYDLHCNESVQRNIARIIKDINNQSNISFIGIEGYTEKLDNSILKNFKNLEAKEKAVHSLLKKGILLGVQLYDINRKDEVYIYGIEDREIYYKNLKELQDVLKSGEYKKELELIKESFSGKLSNKDLNKFLKIKNSYNNNKISLDTYLEKIYKTYYREILQKKHYPNLNSYIKLKKLDKVHQEFPDIVKVMEELKYLESKIEKMFCKTKEELEIVKSIRILNILDKYLRAKVSKKEYEEYLVRISWLLKKLELYNTSKIREQLKRVDKFYNTACKRDEILAGNLIDYMRLPRSKAHRFDKEEGDRKDVIPDLIGNPEDNSSIKELQNKKRYTTYDMRHTSVLIVGGFHVKGITNILRSKGISYNVIIPNGKMLGNESEIYKNILLNKENIFKSTLSLGPCTPQDMLEALLIAEPNYNEILIKAALYIELHAHEDLDDLISVLGEALIRDSNYNIFKEFGYVYAAIMLIGRNNDYSGEGVFDLIRFSLIEKMNIKLGELGLSGSNTLKSKINNKIDEYIEKLKYIITRFKVTVSRELEEGISIDVLTKKIIEILEAEEIMREEGIGSFDLSKRFEAVFGAIVPRNRLNEYQDVFCELSTYEEYAFRESDQFDKIERIQHIQNYTFVITSQNLRERIWILSRDVRGEAYLRPVCVKDFERLELVEYEKTDVIFLIADDAETSSILTFDRETSMFVLINSITFEDNLKRDLKVVDGCLFLNTYIDALTQDGVILTTLEIYDDRTGEFNNVLENKVFTEDDIKVVDDKVIIRSKDEGEEKYKHLTIYDVKTRELINFSFDGSEIERFEVIDGTVYIILNKKNKKQLVVYNKDFNRFDIVLDNKDNVGKIVNKNGEIYLSFCEGNTNFIAIVYTDSLECEVITDYQKTDNEDRWKFVGNDLFVIRDVVNGEGYELLWLDIEFSMLVPIEELKMTEFPFEVGGKLFLKLFQRGPGGRGFVIFNNIYDKYDLVMFNRRFKRFVRRDEFEGHLTTEPIMLGRGFFIKYKIYNEAVFEMKRGILIYNEEDDSFTELLERRDMIDIDCSINNRIIFFLGDIEQDEYGGLHRERKNVEVILYNASTKEKTYIGKIFRLRKLRTIGIRGFLLETDRSLLRYDKRTKSFVSIVNGHILNCFVLPDRHIFIRYKYFGEKKIVIFSRDFRVKREIDPDSYYARYLKGVYNFLPRYSLAEPREFDVRLEDLPENHVNGQFIRQNIDFIRDVRNYIKSDVLFELFMNNFVRINNFNPKIRQKLLEKSLFMIYIFSHLRYNELKEFSDLIMSYEEQGIELLDFFTHSFTSQENLDFKDTGLVDNLKQILRSSDKRRALERYVNNMDIATVGILSTLPEEVLRHNLPEFLGRFNIFRSYLINWANVKRFRLKILQFGKGYTLHMLKKAVVNSNLDIYIGLLDRFDEELIREFKQDIIPIIQGLMDINAVENLSLITIDEINLLIDHIERMNGGELPFELVLNILCENMKQVLSEAEIAGDIIKEEDTMHGETSKTIILWEVNENLKLHVRQIIYDDGRIENRIILPPLRYIGFKEWIKLMQEVTFSIKSANVSMGQKMLYFIRERVINVLKNVGEPLLDRDMRESGEMYNVFLANQVFQSV